MNGKGIILGLALGVVAALGACSGADSTGLGVLSHTAGGARDGGSGAAADAGSALPTDPAPTDPGRTTNGGTPLPCDVDAVLAKHCRSCHGATPAYGATAPLVSWDDLTSAAPHVAGKKVYEDVGARIHDASKPMPPPPNALLSSADIATLDAWVAAGAPRGNQACAAPSGGDDAVKPLSCTPDTLIRPTAAYAVKKDKIDEYVCYGFDVTPTSKRQVVALAPKIDNKKVVHHLLLFQADSAVSATPTPCSGGASAGWRMVSGWAPGGQNVELPPEAGFPESGTTHWVLQVHYNNINALDGQTDASGYDLCTTDKLRPNDADVMAFGSIDMSLAPRATTDITCSYDWSLLSPKVHIFSASPHMHTLGNHMSTYVGSTKVVDQPFDFQTQVGYPASVDVNPGDTVKTRCVWNNTTDSTVTFGEDTSNEMCFSFVSYYPKMDTPLWSWIVPSALASCSPTN